MPYCTSSITPLACACRSCLSLSGGGEVSEAAVAAASTPHAQQQAGSSQRSGAAAMLGGAAPLPLGEGDASPGPPLGSLLAAGSTFVRSLHRDPISMQQLYVANGGIISAPFAPQQQQQRQQKRKRHQEVPAAIKQQRPRSRRRVAAGVICHALLVRCSLR